MNPIADRLVEATHIAYRRGVIPVRIWLTVPDMTELLSMFGRNMLTKGNRVPKFNGTIVTQDPFNQPSRVLLPDGSTILL